jgi:hypothetical protein
MHEGVFPGQRLSSQDSRWDEKSVCVWEKLETHPAPIRESMSLHATVGFAGQSLAHAEPRATGTGDMPKAPSRQYVLLGEEDEMRLCGFIHQDWVGEDARGLDSWRNRAGSP